jgi:hypothetical protein
MRNKKNAEYRFQEAFLNIKILMKMTAMRETTNSAGR